jgi:hypothetical protein
MSQNNASNKPPASGKPRRTEIGGTRDLNAKPPSNGKPRRTEIGGTRDLNSIPEDTEQPIAQEITEEILPGEDENEE